MSGHAIEILLVAGVVAPLLGFAVLCFFGARMGKPQSGYFAVSAIGTSTVLAALALVLWHRLPDPADAVQNAWRHHWADLGSLPILIGVQLDSLTVIMFFMVAFVSFWIFVFSLGYMAGHSDEIDGQSKYHRFFTYLCLFCFSMLGLVISNSILFLFIFWELVGLCSYFLIGFYFHKKSASNAAIKAFVTNRVGDFGFLIGLMMVVYFLKDLTLDGAAAAFSQYHATGHAFFTDKFLGVTLATWMGICLFCGAVGKSAQFPLHVWLPDAMEGPTPVSALIHAATMVAAGVYLVARIFRLLTPDAQFVVAVIGAVTLSLAALIAIVQTDIKKVLAYSTVSQLGYMIFGMGVGAWIGALFHLLTHAFFKALLFLGSGQVIEGCHHEQDITKMGGLRHKMPVTCWTFFIAVLAISGVGLPLLNTMPFTGLGGYYSKDEILAVAYYRAARGSHIESSGYEENGSRTAGAPKEGGAETDHRSNSDGGEFSLAGIHAHKLLFWIAAMGAYITPFYMMRVWWLTFMGSPRDPRVHEHAHESRLMYIPLAVLAVGTFLVSWFVFRPMVAASAPTTGLVRALDGHSQAVHHLAHVPLAKWIWPSFIVGFAIAWLIYRNGLEAASRIARVLRPLHTLLVNKFYFDEIYGAHILKKASVASLTGLVAMGRQASRWFDNQVIDFLVNLTASVTRWLSNAAGRVLDAAGVLGRIEEDRSYRTQLVMWIVSVVLAVATVRYMILEAWTYAGVTSVAATVLLGVDGMVEGLARGTWDFGGAVRTPQTGKIRSYLLFAAGGLAGAVMVISWVR